MEVPTTPDECYAFIWIKDKKLTPNEITDLIGLRPSRSHERGESVYSQWILSSEDNVKSRNSEAHIEWILNCLEKTHISKLQLLKEQGSKIELRCYCFNKGTANFMAFEPEMMRRISELGIIMFCETWCSFDAD